MRKHRRRQLAFRGICLLSPVLLLFLVNFALYCLGIGVDTTLVIPSSRPTAGNVFSFNTLTDIAYSEIDLRGPEPRAFKLPKPPGLFRVVVIGASTVQGFPYPSELAFPRQLELVLSDQLPSKHVQVLNAGIVGLSTTPLVDVARQALTSDPDLIVCYAGHNEFYGVGGVATSASLSRLGIELRRYRLVQLLSRMMGSEDDPSEMLITRLPGDFNIPPHSDLVKRAERKYQDNLTQLTEMCEEAKVPLVLCSVVCNLRDQSPMVSHSALEPADAQQRDRLLESAERFMEADQFEDAMREIEQAERLDPTFALITYRKAQCLDALQRFEEARACYSAARDLDACRFRASSKFRDIVREVASSAAESGVCFVDLVQSFSETQPQRAPGREFFFEHVHLTLEGHWLVAQTIARRIVEDIQGQEWNQQALPSVEDRDEWLGLIPLDELSATILSSFIVQTPPLDKAADAKEQLRVLEARIQKLTKQISPTELGQFYALDHQTKVDDLVHGMGQLKLDRGDTEGALQLFERAQRRRPWMPHSHLYAAICHHLLGDDQKARADVERSYETIVAETDRLIHLRRQLEEQLE